MNGSSKDRLRILMVASEAAPFAKSGGLGDVVGALVGALRQRGLDVRLVLPRYGWIPRQPLTPHRRPLHVPVAGGRTCGVLEGRLHGAPVYFIEHNLLYDRPYLYGPPNGAYEDNCLRFALLSRGALELCGYLDFWPQVVQANDWQASLVPVFLNALQLPTPSGITPASVLTLHNLAHQGLFDSRRFRELGLDGAPLQHLGLISGEGLNLLRAGILHATLLTTVSPTYAQEIQTAGYGEGLEGVLRTRRADLFGVLNGIDTAVWNPQQDPLLPRRYSVSDLLGKQECKAALQREAGLALRPEVPLLGLVARLVPQKGIDLLAAIADRLLDLDTQLVLLGTGERWAEAFFADLAARRPDRCRAWISFDERLAHLIEAGADMFLMPSRFEPCGLNQMYSQTYGTLPIVRATGGLQDTVENFDERSGQGTGFKFDDATPEALLSTITWALRVYRENRVAFRAMIQRAMAIDHGWARAAATYEYLLRLSVVRRCAPR